MAHTARPAATTPVREDAPDAPLYPEFDLARTPLKNQGTLLIEASAGTGKTYTLTGLVLRLIIEQNRPITQILVATYTRAATAELRASIRAALVKARDAFEADPGEEPADTPESVRPYLTEKCILFRRDYARLLRDALADFDDAPISTIHSFCARVLKEFAFESATFFRTDIQPENQPVYQRIADDFHRKYLVHAPSIFVAAIADEVTLKPESLARLAGVIDQRRNLDFGRENAGEQSALDELTRTAQDLTETVREVVAEYQKDPAALREQLIGREAEKWAKKPGFLDPLRKRWFIFESLTESASPFFAPGDLELFDYLNTAKARHGTRKNSSTPDLEIFRLGDRIGRLRETLPSLVKRAALEYAAAELREARQKADRVSYNHLAQNLVEALQGPYGENLCAALRKRYTVALIDEFQDTDAEQYRIVEQIFRKQLLILVGDPKQAIYRFRGADLYSYLNAAKQADLRYTLARNWRSEKNLVAAVNAIYERAPAPFAIDQIKYRRVKAAGTADQQPLKKGSLPEPPFHFVHLPSEDDETGDTRNITAARNLFVAWTVEEILTLLQGDYFLGQKRIAPDDIAILVRTHHDAEAYQSALAERRIPSVLSNTGNVWAEPEAQQLWRILRAVAQPENEGRLRTALATGILGFNAAEIEALVADEPAWEKLISHFRLFQLTWLRRGFMPMFGLFMQRQRIALTLIKQMRGERALTNLAQLAELIHAEEAKTHRGMDALIQWTGQRCAAAKDEDSPTAPEEQQLRLDRDESAVRILTMHTSKGLQFPIVFCPCCWGGLRDSNRIYFQPEKNAYRWELDEPKDTPNLRAQIENLADELRLIYVALTRAQHRCYLADFIPSKKGAAIPTALQFLLHTANPESGRETLLENFFQESDPVPDARVASDLRRLKEKFPAVFEIHTISSAVGDDSRQYSPQDSSHLDRRNLRAREFTAKLERDWRVSSFSLLKAMRAETDIRANALDEEFLPGVIIPSAEIGARDEQEAGGEDENFVHENVPADLSADEPSPSELSPLHDFPSGPKAGTFFHALLERVDFATAGHHRELLHSLLIDFNISIDRFGETISHWLRTVLSYPLHPEKADFSLAQLKSPHHVSREMEFFLPMSQITPSSLAEIFSRHAAADSPIAQVAPVLARSSFDSLQGYLRGFIDLIYVWEDRYYIVDWKSNYLGQALSDYHADQLPRHVIADLYPLQYTLYTLALHRLLQSKSPGYRYDRHFGGVTYVFLRGISENFSQFPPAGLFHDCPPANLISALDALFSGN